jgi:hypothetical protein
MAEHGGGLKDLPQSGFGFGRRACTGKHIARNNLFINVAKLLWAFDLEVGVSEVTGKREEVDATAGTEGFVFSPTPFKAVFRPRGPWARDLIEREGDSHQLDYAKILEQVGNDMATKSAKT